MIGWIVRILLVFAGVIASWFIAHDALNFGIVQMIVAIIVFVLFILIAAFLPTFKNWIEDRVKKSKKS